LIKRLFGRTIGIIFAVPFAYFISKGYLLPKMKLFGLAMLSLGGF